MKGSGNFYANFYHFGRYVDGTVYEGQWWEGKQHGQGRAVDMDGAIYEGPMVEGKRQALWGGVEGRR